MIIPKLYPVNNPTEKLSRVQFPTGMGYFRPDLNFEGTSEREIEVRPITGMVKYRVEWRGQNKNPIKPSFLFPLASLVAFLHVMTVVHVDKKLLGRRS